MRSHTLSLLLSGQLWDRPSCQFDIFPCGEADQSLSLESGVYREISVKQRPVCHSTSMLTFALFSAVRLHTKLKMCKSESKPNPKTETTICWIIHMKILSTFTHLLTLKLFSSMEHKIWISVEIPECCFQYNNFFVLCRENED